MGTGYVVTHSCLLSPSVHGMVPLLSTECQQIRIVHLHGKSELIYNRIVKLIHCLFECRAIASQVHF